MLSLARIYGVNEVFMVYIESAIMQLSTVQVHGPPRLQWLELLLSLQPTEWHR